MEPFSASATAGRGGRVRVLLIGDDPLARSGLAALLGGEPGIAIVAQSAAGEDAAAAVAEHDPDVILWDLGPRPESPLELPGMPAEEGAPLLALAPDDGPAAEALAAGARGVLYRDADAGRLAAALQAVARGLAVLDGGLAETLLRPQAAEAASPADLDAPVEPLTPREVEVLQLLAQGLSNKLIGSRLGISEHTAKFHVNAILGKLGAQSRTDAVVRAARLGWILL